MPPQADRLTPAELLEAASQLGSRDLEQLVRHLLALRARRHAPQIPAEEAKLLQEINRGLPVLVRERYEELLQHRRALSLTPAEHQELLVLTDQVEELEAERAKALVELAKLRRRPLQGLMAELGIRGPEAA